jgi:hypothetical protein
MQDEKVVKPWVEVALLGSEEMGHDLYTSLVMSFAAWG